MPNTDNYKEQGGSKWIINGTIEMDDGTHIVINEETLETILAAKADSSSLDEKLTAAEAVIQADSVAETVETLKTDFNALLTKLKSAGIMASE